MQKTQRTWVEELLLVNGEITRNQCLRNYVSRLGAIICDMKKDGWDITTSRREGDYVYTLGKAPSKTKWVYELVNGIRVPKQIIVPYHGLQEKL